MKNVGNLFWRPELLHFLPKALYNRVIEFVRKGRNTPHDLYDLPACVTCLPYLYDLPACMTCLPEWHACVTCLCDGHACLHVWPDYLWWVHELCGQNDQWYRIVHGTGVSMVLEVALPWTAMIIIGGRSVGWSDQWTELCIHHICIKWNYPYYRC